jgi:hypothetical protein
MKSILLACLCIFLLGPPGDEATPTPGNPLPEITTTDLVNLVNVGRGGNGLAALTVDPILMSTAQWTADTMAAGQLQGHIGDVKSRVLAAGYGAGDDAWATENFAIAPPGEEELVLQIWADDTHQIPMVNPAYTHIGAGVAQAADGSVYMVVHAAYTSMGKYVSGSQKTATPGGSTATVAPAEAAVSQYIAPMQMVTPLPDGSLVHTVGNGQSLWSIAIAYGTTIRQIQGWNQYAEDDLTVYNGQKLLVGFAPTHIPVTPTANVGGTPEGVTPDQSLPRLAASATSTLAPTPAETPTAEPVDPGADGEPLENAVGMAILIMCAIGAGLIGLGVWMRRG